MIFVKNVTLTFTASSYDLLISWLPPVYYSDDISSSLDYIYTYHVTVFDGKGNPILNNNVPSTFVKVANITKCDTFHATITAFLHQDTSNNRTIRNNGSEYHATENFS